jgi:mRNA interferase MazF
MQRGEVWWASIRLGNSRKRRPMLVVSHDAFNTNPHYPKILAVHLTSVRRSAEPYSWEVAIPKRAAGIPKPSVAKCAEIYTLWKDQLGTRCGSLPAELMARVDRALAIALALPS